MNEIVNARQILMLTRANLKTRYRNTVSGFLWVILNPILIFGAQSYVFHTILKLDVKDYVLFLASGLLPWIFLAQTIEMGSGHFVSSGRMLKSFPIAPMTLLLAMALDNLINFTVAFLLVLVPVGVMSNFDFFNLIALPIPLAFLLLGTLSMTWILATMNVIFRDIKFIVSFVMTVAFYLTPVFYPLHFVGENYRWLVNYNVFYLLIDPFREMIYGPFQTSFFISCLKAAGISLALFMLSVVLWKRKRNAVYNYL